MRNALQNGVLVVWKDDSGFGFIKPDKGGKEILLQISAFQGLYRRPEVGDRISYKQVTTSNGKIRATEAFIQGVVLRSLPNKKIEERGKALETAIRTIILISIVVVSISIQFSKSSVRSPIDSIMKPGCIVKGNISQTTGNKWYHVPGMENYTSTVIDSAFGEKWFCSESEAIANGWSKAPK